VRVDFPIKDDIITWAIERAGYKFMDFVSKFPVVKDWLEHKKKPTIKQLEDFSNRVHIPFGYLFLDEPPREQLPIPFFRTGKGEIRQVSLNVYDTILSLQRRQDWLEDYLEGEKHDKVPFVGRFNVNSGAEAIIKDIRSTLDLPYGWANGFFKHEDALNYLVGKVEASGIVVVFNSVVANNNTRKVEIEECRGFVIIGQYAPFMFVNAADSKGAQIFTVLHELAHVWLGKSAGFDSATLLPADDPIELLCDKVAAEFLVPSQELLRLWSDASVDNLYQLAKYFKVSTIVIARRALDLGKIPRQTFFGFYRLYQEELAEKKRKQSEGGGGDFYASQGKRISLKFASHINQALKENKILFRDAYQLTGLKGSTFARFVKEQLHQ
jgi:Zn-dependent peptidase ImmA (M78 family)